MIYNFIIIINDRPPANTLDRFEAEETKENSENNENKEKIEDMMDFKEALLLLNKEKKGLYIYIYI